MQGQLKAYNLSASLLIRILAERLAKIDLEAVEELLIMRAALSEQFLSPSLCALLLEGVFDRTSFGKLILNPGLLGL